MSMGIARERLERALEQVTDAHRLPFDLSYEVASRILVRVHGFVEGNRLANWHACLRTAAEQESGLTDEERAYYRKAINAYWQLSPSRASGNGRPMRHGA